MHKIGKKLSALLVILYLCFTTNLLAEEKILSFDSDIVITTDGSMLVTETIRVKAEANKIRRGIYRDFPTKYKDRLGNNYQVDFSILGVERDANRENYHTKSMSNGVRIYFGNANVFLDPGVYTYRFKYKTNYQLGFFDEHDELYWNVTGNGWDFSIDKASATLRLPKPLQASDMPMLAYTGLSGASEKNFISKVLEPGVTYYETTKPLAPRQGLTVVTGWPKGVISEPTQADKINRFTSVNKHILTGFTGLLLLLTYFLIVWFKVGRDPGAGVIYPRYNPPEGYGPDELRFITKMGYDNKTFTSFIVLMAATGFLTIKESKKFFSYKYTLIRKDSNESGSRSHRGILKALFKKGQHLELDDENHKEINKAQRLHKKQLSKKFKNKYFYTNSLFYVIGVLATIALILITFSLTIQSDTGPVVFFMVLLCSVITCIAFYHLLKAPTLKSRDLLDHIEGFKEYASIAEGQEIKYAILSNAPGLNVEIFEKYLPYAIALDVEQDWAAKFTRVFARLSGEQRNYSPSWYQGSSFSSHNLGGFTSSLGNTMNSTISSASHPPGSSSGGGGFSGGGGGGGGGGGW
ncbi:MAG: DUF2207 domain-containing protein [Gammaproteobacteria bacterium]|nr:DUF2207 domain-containing protein [Gammaproteobacteria bacterium]